MDSETGQALDGRIDTLTGEVRGLREEFRAEVGGLRNELQGGLDGVRYELRAEIRASEAALREEIRSGLAETRRHADVLFESLRDDIRLVAEGLGTLTTRLDSLRP